MWMSPACMNMGRIKRHHWLGSGLSLILASRLYLGSGMPPNPHKSDKVQSYVEVSDEVVLGHGQLMVSLAFVMPSTLCIQGVNLAPKLIKTYVEGPIIGLKEGLIMIGEPVSMTTRHVSSWLVSGTDIRSGLTILRNLADEDAHLHHGEDVYNPRNAVAVRAEHAQLAEPHALLLLRSSPLRRLVDMIEIVIRILGSTVLQRYGVLRMSSVIGRRAIPAMIRRILACQMLAT